MTFIPKQQNKHCFIACSKDKVNAGLCDCVNRMRNEALRKPLVSGSFCKHYGVKKEVKDGVEFYCRDCGIRL